MVSRAGIDAFSDDDGIRSTRGEHTRTSPPRPFSSSPRRGAAAQHDLSSLRTLFVAGERADPDTVARARFERRWWRCRLRPSGDATRS
jgi:hypothetical protein